MFSTILIANRGEIALRVARTCREMGIRTIAVVSEPDRDSAVARYADKAVTIGPAAARRSYLDPAAVVTAALQNGAEAIHPGYGFLSEDPDFAEICEANGLVFVGCRAELLRRLGDKAVAREIAQASGLPIMPGSTSSLTTLEEGRAVAAEIGYPLIIKATAGGGGRGMTVVRDPRDFAHAWRTSRAAAQSTFGDARLYIERFMENARHVEVQVLGDGLGGVVHLGERDCSVQRRRQKLIEETPAPGLPTELAERIRAAAVHAARSVNYAGAGTYEFLVDSEGGFVFMEVNCRIQVEHPVTEEVTGVDIVREQLRVAAGDGLSVTQDDIQPRGVSIECRVNAEDPARGFIPTAGVLDEFEPPSGPFVRVDTHGFPGFRITADYDPLIAKVTVWAPDRRQAIERADRVLGEFRIAGRGLHTSIGYLQEVLRNPVFRAAKHTTDLVDQMNTATE